MRSFVLPRIKRLLPKSTGSSATASARSSSRSRDRRAASNLPGYPFYAICVNNGDGEYEVMLKLGKPYKVLRPWKNDPPYLFRVVDEEGEDYLYPDMWLVPLELPAKHKRRLTTALAEARQ